MRRHSYRRIFFLSFGLTLAATLPAADTKLKPEELVEKHLASLGTPESRNALKSREISGSSQVIFRQGGTGRLAGTAMVMSEGPRFRIGMAFNQPAYPGEQLAFDGNKVTVGDIRPGQRSPLSEFIYNFDTIIKEGLLGGALTTAWALQDVAGRKPRLSYEGLKKVEGRELHELKYRPRKGGGDLQIALYFEPDSCRHVRTRYRHLGPSGMGPRPTDSSSRGEARYLIEEFFDDFRALDGIAIPHAYRLVFTMEEQSGTSVTEWNIAVSKAMHNQAIDPSQFTVR
jgi:hypothetical protein